MGESIKTLDCAGRTTREINAFLKETAPFGAGRGGGSCCNPDSRHNFAVGLTTPLRLHIEGHVGYYCAGLCEGVDVRIAGDAGWGLGREPDGRAGCSSPARRGRRRARPCAAER